MSLSPTIQRIYLIGLMGGGKSTVGKLLADVLGWTLIDLDNEIERVCGKTIPAIFEDEGEPGFRDHEITLLAETAKREQVIIACGGGIVTRLHNVEYLAGQVTVWLELSPAEAAVRLEHADERPLLRECQDTIQQLNEILIERREAYQRAARIRVNSGGVAPELVASNILRALEHLND